MRNGPKENARMEHINLPGPVAVVVVIVVSEQTRKRTGNRLIKGQLLVLQERERWYDRWSDRGAVT